MADTDPNATLMADVTPGNFEIGSAMVAYGETKLGGTDGAISVSVEPKTREVKCDQNGDNAVAVYITGYDVKVKAKFKEISKVLPVLIGTGKKLSSADFGKNLLDDTNGSAKALTVVGLKRSLRVPKAISIAAWEYAISGTEEHGIEIEFTGFKDANGVFLEEVVSGV